MSTSFLGTKILIIRVLFSITKYIAQTLDKHNYILFINHISDLYQFEASCMFERKNKTFNIILHVQFVKHEYMLTLHQYLPFPLSQDLANNHSLTPSVGEKDILSLDLNILSKSYPSRIWLAVTMLLASYCLVKSTNIMTENILTDNHTWPTLSLYYVYAFGQLMFGQVYQ